MTINYKKILSSRKLLLNLAKAAIAIGLIIYLFNHLNFNDLYFTLNKSNKIFILFSLMLLPLNLFLQYKKWELTCINFLNFSDKGKILLSLFYGFSAGIFTPVRVGEFFARAIPIKESPVLQVAASSFADKLFTLIIVAFCGALASSLYLLNFNNIPYYIILSLIIIIISLFAFVIYLFVTESFWDNILIGKLKEKRIFASYREKFSLLKLTGRHYSLRMLLLSFSFYACYILQFSLLLAAFSGKYKAITYIWISNLIMFSKTIIPISFGELGVREGASVYFIQKFGEDAAIGFNASILLFLINVLVPSVIGIFLLLKKNNDK
ncbi:MAG: lysylphosphatidylglycerol synthase domain-containing protein [Bacteroidota bacterium]|nr:lysylphosphatidylglycerol synthase domain-containing protein [Bacteroidota bacterium]